MSIMQYNGSAIIGMKGKDCVAIASDRRFGVQQTTIATDNQRIYKIHNRLYIGLSGLMTDVQTVGQILKFRHDLYKLREERNMSPRAFTKVVSSMLYSRRFGPYFVEPIIVGMEDDGSPFIAAMDLIGATEICENFACVGTTENELYGCAENLWNKDMHKKDLFETISQSLLSAVDRDCLAGWGGIVYVIDKKSVTVCELKGRQD